MSDATASSDISYADQYDLRQILEWQTDRFHHYQSLSQGFIVGSLTLLAVLATLFSVLVVLLGDIPVPESSSVAVTSSAKAAETILPLGYLSIQIIVGFNTAIFLILLALSADFFVTGVWKQLDIVTLGKASFVPTDLSPDFDVSRPSDVLFADDVESNTTISEYVSRIDRNGAVLETIHADFEASVLRLLVSVLFLLLSVYIYHGILNYSAGILAILNLGLILPDRIYPRPLLNRLSTDTTAVSNDQDSMKRTLFQELMINREKESRWARVKPNLFEKLALGITKVLSAISFFSALASLIYQVVV
jgi:hypothetical protein